MSRKKAPVIHDLKLTVWQASLFKLSTISFGVLLAIYTGGFLIQYLPIIWVAFLAPGIYILYVYLKS
jgi:hypothetical protein